MTPVSDADGVYLKQLELGPMQNFVYLVGDPGRAPVRGGRPGLGDRRDRATRPRPTGMTITGALVTHTHQDHVGGSLASWGMPGRIAGVEELLAKRPGQGLRAQGRARVPAAVSAPTSCKVDNHDTLDGRPAAR